MLATFELLKTGQANLFLWYAPAESNNNFISCNRIYLSLKIFRENIFSEIFSRALELTVVQQSCRKYKWWNTLNRPISGLITNLEQFHTTFTRRVWTQLQFPLTFIFYQVFFNGLLRKAWINFLPTPILYFVNEYLRTARLEKTWKQWARGKDSIAEV